MRKVLDILRLAHDGGRSQREIAGSLALSQSTVSECLARFRASGLAWPLAPDVDEAAFDRSHPTHRLKVPPSPHFALNPRAGFAKCTHVLWARQNGNATRTGCARPRRQEYRTSRNFENA
jgi:hypothetical protein